MATTVCLLFPRRSLENLPELVSQVPSGVVPGGVNQKTLPTASHEAVQDETPWTSAPHRSSSTAPTGQGAMTPGPSVTRAGRDEHRLGRTRAPGDELWPRGSIRA